MSTWPRIRLGDGDPRHGTENGYTNLGCRCDDCRAINTERITVQRERRRQGLANDDPRHGLASTYSNYGCRCRSCTTAKVANNRELRMRRGA